MRECIVLARRGAGSVSPNPMVGCVIVKEGRVVGRGYHRRFGHAHAEREALRVAGKTARGATLFVNLEPCSHYGKTPPCVDAIVDAGIYAVIIGTKDPNPLVSGRGAQVLRKAGVRVENGVLEEESQKLNEAFFKYVRKGIPFVALKIAQTVDGKIATQSGESRWITSKEARTEVHRLRSQYDAVLVGAGTILADDPRLTVRHVRGRNPLRVLLDGRFRSPVDATLFANCREARTIIFVSDAAYRAKRKKVSLLQKRGVEVISLPSKRGRFSLRPMLRELGKRRVTSVLVEGGQQTYSEFLRHRLADKVFVFTAPKIFGDGVAAIGTLKTPSAAHSVLLTPYSIQKVGPDTLLTGYFNHKSGRHVYRHR